VGEQAKDGISTLRRPSLGEESRALARTRIVQGALASLAVSGLDATVDEVAEAAGVSRRTVFRHFATHGELFAAAIAEGIQVLEARMPGPPPPGDDIEKWLIDTAVTMHELYRELVGRAFWDIHIERPGTPPEVVSALSDVPSFRRRYVTRLAAAAWEPLGGKGLPPEWVVDAFVLQLSGFASNAMATYSSQKAGEVSARILWVVLQGALAESHEASVKRTSSSRSHGGGAPRGSATSRRVG